VKGSLTEKQLTGALFGAICLFGMTAGLSPSRCSRILHFKKAANDRSLMTEETKTRATATAFQGHHPACGNFSVHIVRFGGRTYCAGCMGLVTGAALALSGSFLYFFLGLHVGEVGILAFWSGMIGVACGLLQYNRFVRRSVVHFLLNVAFVLGTFLLLIGVAEVNGNLLLDSYLLALIVYWILTRTMLSRFEHERICAACGLKQCNLSFG